MQAYPLMLQEQTLQQAMLCHALQALQVYLRLLKLLEY